MSDRGYPRCMPLLRALVSGACGWNIGTNLADGTWWIVALNVLGLVALWWMPLRGIFKQAGKRCVLCGERPAWFFSLIPPPPLANRAYVRLVLPHWVMWAACEAHRERIREVIGFSIGRADLECTEPAHDHDGQPLLLFEVSSRYGRRR